MLAAKLGFTIISSGDNNSNTRKTCCSVFSDFVVKVGNHPTKQGNEIKIMNQTILQNNQINVTFLP